MEDYAVVSSVSPDQLGMFVVYGRHRIYWLRASSPEEAKGDAILAEADIDDADAEVDAFLKARSIATLEQVNSLPGMIGVFRGKTPGKKDQWLVRRADGTFKVCANDKDAGREAHLELEKMQKEQDEREASQQDMPSPISNHR